MIISDKQKEFIRNAHHRYNLKVRSQKMWKNISRQLIYNTKTNNRKKRKRWLKFDFRRI
jgi:hypothetical protein